MSYVKFKPEFWSEKIMRDNAKLLVLANLANREYEGEIKMKGDRVNILGIGGVTIKDYTGADIDNPETPEDTSVQLVIDKAKYFNVFVDDIDKRQSALSVMDAIMQEANEGMADIEDTDIGAEVLSGAGIKLSATSSLTVDLSRSLIQTAKTKLRKNGVRNTAAVCAVVSPEYFAKLEIKAEELATNNDSVMENGFEGKVNGVEIYVSNNLPKDGSNNEVMFVFTKNRAFAHAEQINEVKAYSPEKRFGDAIKGLNCYGTKVVRPKEIVAIPVTAYAA